MCTAKTIIFYEQAEEGSVPIFTEAVTPTNKLQLLINAASD